MNRVPVAHLAALGEGVTSEFKRSGASRIGREMCGFANATGGATILGVADDGEVVGMADAGRKIPVRMTETR